MGLRFSADTSQASILSDTGATCVCELPYDDAGNCANNSQWTMCKDGLSSFVQVPISAHRLTISRC